MKKLSVIIPTLQKNINLLNNLISTIDRDNFVSEIILIDNSRKGYSFNSEKLRVIIPEKNLFVNPSWNLGVKEAKEQIVALFNDDIIIPENFCKSVILQMNESMGIVGFHRDFIENIKETIPAIKSTKPTLIPASGRCGHFGIVMFFYKTSFYEIPEDIKIFWGDDWLYYQNKKHNTKNYYIVNQKLYHYGGLTSSDKKISMQAKNDSKLYRKYTRNLWQQIFYYEPVFRGFRLTICGLELLYHYDKNH